MRTGTHRQEVSVPAVWMTTGALVHRPGRLRSALVCEEPTVLWFAPEAATRICFEDAWELHGPGALWVVAVDGADRAADALACAALGHRPRFVRPAHGTASARQAVIEVMLQLERGQVLIVVAQDGRAARSWVAQGARWRSSWEAAEGDYHALHHG